MLITLVCNKNSYDLASLWFRWPIICNRETYRLARLISVKMRHCVCAPVFACENLS